MTFTRCHILRGGKTVLVKLTCPHCGAAMDVDDNRDKIFCSFCGTEIANLKEKIEITQNVNMSGTVRHVMDRSNEPNLYISYASAVPSVVMIVNVVDSGIKNTYLNGMSQTYHLSQGQHVVVLKIGKRNYNRTIFIPSDNSPVRINATFTGRSAEITIDQPNETEDDKAAADQAQTGSRQAQPLVKTEKKRQSVLAIISFVLSFLLYAAFAAVPLAILDLILSKKDKDHSHGLAIAALIIGTIMSFSMIVTLVGGNKSIITNSAVPVAAEESTLKSTTSSASNWEIDHYIDDFGDETGSAYLRGTFQGKYSNSLSSDHKLTVYFCYDDEQKAFIIRLLEYNKYKAKFSSLDKINLKVKLDDKEYTIDLKVADSGSDLYFKKDDKEFSTIKNALLQGKEMKCIIKESILGQTYSFTIDGIGFNDMLQEAGN